MKIEVLIVAETTDCTLSQMRIDGQFFCFILEDGFRDKKVHGQTRIPDGTYPVKQRREGKFFDQYFRQYGHEFVAHIDPVPNFKFILIHQGNTPADTDGCLLVGDAIERRTDGSFRITAGTSSMAYKRFYTAIAEAFQIGRTVTITLKRDAVIASAPQIATA